MSLKHSAGSVNKLTASLRAVKKAFPDKYDLHSRIDLALSSTKIRVAVIPFQSRRTDINGVMEAVLADPLASDQSWYHQFRTRLLAKDGLIRHSPKFDHVLTHNSLIEFPVPYKQELPSRAREIEVLEANSYKDSFDHVKTCHFHIFVSSHVQAAMTHKLPSHYPSALVLDVPKVDPSLEIGNIAISSKTALEGNDLLAESPANVTKYHNLYKDSNISKAEQLIFGNDPKSIEKSLLESITSTCNDIVAPVCNDELNNTVKKESARIEELRKDWARNAHQELQTHLSEGLDKWGHSAMPWWKLYYRVDDIHDSISMNLPNIYLTQSRSNLNYLLGRIDAFADKHYLPDVEVEMDEDTGAGTRSYNGYGSSFATSLRDILSGPAVVLHNRGLKSLATVLFGLQLPTTVIPLLGVYFYDYSWYSMGSVIGLGLVVGLRRLQTSWTEAFGQFKSNVLEHAKETLAKCEQAIWQRWEAKVVAQQQVVRSRQAKVDQLDQAIRDEY